MTGDLDELLDNVMSKLEQIGLNPLNLIYDGTTKFLNRDYYMIRSFDSFEDHIIRIRDIILIAQTERYIV